MLIQHIALVSEDNGPSGSELARVAAVLQEQVMRDLAPLWGVSAAIHAFPALEDVPIGVWPIVVTGRRIGGQAGIHLDDNGQPYAHIQASETWSLRASRVCLEMLVNPTEERRVVARSPLDPEDLAEYLVEICGPCDPRRGYPIHGILVSDFCTPAYYGLRLPAGDGFSIHGSTRAPLELARYGHLTWRELSTNTWWLRSHWTSNPIDTELGALDKRIVSVREFVQTCADGFDLPEGSQLVEYIEKYQLATNARAIRLRSIPTPRLDPALEQAFLSLRHRHSALADEVIDVPYDLPLDSRDPRTPNRPLLAAQTPSSGSVRPSLRGSGSARGPRKRRSLFDVWSAHDSNGNAEDYEVSGDQNSIPPVVRTATGDYATPKHRTLVMGGVALALTGLVFGLLYAGSPAPEPVTTAQQPEVKPTEIPPPPPAAPSEPPPGIEAPAPSVAQAPPKQVIKRAARERVLRPAIIQRPVVASAPPPAADPDQEITALIETRE